MDFLHFKFIEMDAAAAERDVQEGKRAATISLHNGTFSIFSFSITKY